MKMTGTNNVARFLLICLCSFLVFGCATRSASGPNGPSLSAKPSSAEFEDIKKRLDKAFEEVKQGKRNVVVDLNEDPSIVQQGDLVRVNYTATLEDGTLIRTTLGEVAEHATDKKAEGYEEPKSFVPEEVLAGAPASVPGLGDVVLGMAAGEKKSVTLPAEKAYGVRDENKIGEFPRVKKRSKSVEMSPREYLKRYGRFPVLGNELGYDGYFNALVVDVTESSAVLELLPREKEAITDDFGTTVITRDGEEMQIALTPKIGASFRAWKQDGKIVALDADTFTVDFNQPLAGGSVALDVDIISLTKASTLRDVEIPWLEDYDKAIAAAESIGKPIVLVLYSSWCGWCKKLFDRTTQDPRIKALKDRFIWLKIDSDKEPSYKRSFEQKGSPMIVVMDSEGLVLDKMSGYRDAKTFREELDQYLGQTVTS